MSDVWQGPGWWLAPDGKWYPADGGPEGAAPIETPFPKSTIPEATIPEVTEPTEVEPLIDTPVVDMAVVDTPTSSSGGWQAAEVELDEDHTSDDAPLLSYVNPAATDTAATDTAAEDAAAEDAATSEDGWTSGFTGEIPEVDDPESGLPISDDTTPAATVLAAPPKTPATNQPTGRRTPDPIHRDDAWRKPNGGAPPSEVASTPRGAPEVVDLAVPQPVGADAPVDDNTGVSPLLMAIGVTAALLLIAVAINFLFFGDDDNTDVNTDPETSTSAAPSTTAETTTTSDTSVDETTTVDQTTSSEDTTTSASESSEGVEISVFDLQAGDCIESEIGTGQVQQLIKVDCELAHEFEVYREALVDKTIETYDVDAIEAQAQELCRTSLVALIPEGDDRNLMFKWFQPTEQSWNQAGNPDRVITCLLFDEDEKLFGTVG